MKVLIIYDFFNYYNKFLPKIIKKFLRYYDSSKLNSLISQIKKKHSENVELTVISTRNDVINLKSKVNVEFLPKLRIGIEHLKFKQIKDGVIQETKRSLEMLYKNFLDLQIYSLKGIFLPKIFEFELSLFLNEIYGNYELIKNIKHEREFDEIYVFNSDKKAIHFFRDINVNVKIINNNLFLKNHKFLSINGTLYYFLTTLGLYLKRFLAKKRAQKSNSIEKLNRKNIIFFANSENQIKSLLPIYNDLKAGKLYSPIKYNSETFTHPINITKMIRFVLQISKILRHKKGMITKDLTYKSMNIEKLLRIYYFNGHLIDIIRIFNILQNFINFTKRYPPSIVIIPNDFMGTMRTIAGYCKLKKIPILFIPHAAVPIIEEMNTKYDIKHLALGGQYDKENYLQKGVKNENIKVTGVPRYEYFYNNEIIKLSEVRDMFEGRKYNFSEKKFTVLLTTNPIDNESNEKIITNVITSLKQLKLEENLIIKLHPREDGLMHRKTCKKYGINPIIIKDYRILDIIKTSNLLISQKSTTILEAMIVGTPVICLDLVNKSFRETSKYMFLEEKYIKIAYNQDKLTDLIRELYTNKDILSNYIQKLLTNAEKFVFYDKDNPPIKKIVDLITTLI